MSDLAAIQKRDNESGNVWFTGPASFTAQAARDRRDLLVELAACREIQRSGVEYSIKLQRMIEAARRHESPLPSPELHHHKMLTFLMDELAALHEARQQWRSRMGLKVTDDVVVENERLRELLREAKLQIEAVCYYDYCDDDEDVQTDVAILRRIIPRIDAALKEQP